MTCPWPLNQERAEPGFEIKSSSKAQEPIPFPLRAKVTPGQILNGQRDLPKCEVTCLRSPSLFGTGTGQSSPPACSDWLQTRKT